MKLGSLNQVSGPGGRLPLRLFARGAWGGSIPAGASSSGGGSASGFGWPRRSNHSASSMTAGTIANCARPRCRSAALACHSTTLEHRDAGEHRHPLVLRWHVSGEPLDRLLAERPRRLLDVEQHRAVGNLRPRENEAEARRRKCPRRTQRARVRLGLARRQTCAFAGALNYHEPLFA